MKGMKATTFIPFIFRRKNGTFLINHARTPVFKGAHRDTDGLERAAISERRPMK
jgi:hypothetical protein